MSSWRRRSPTSLTGVPRHQIIEEPVARNTAPACGLAAFLIERENPDAVLGVFPSDHVIADEPRFLKALQKGIALAAAGDNIVVLGIEPTRPETGYGYIETGEDDRTDESALRVRRFTEKPNLNRAQEFVAVRKLLLEFRDVSVVGEDAGQCCARTSAGDGSAAGEDCRGFGNAEFEQVFRELYPKCENISVDYAVLEPRSAKGEHASHLYCVPAEFAGTIWVRGLRSTSTRWRRGCAAMATAMLPSRMGT